MKIRYLFIVMLAFTISYCTTLKKERKEPTATDWVSTMQDMANDLKHLAPYIFSREEFNDENNQKKIGVLIKSFVRHSEAVPVHVGEAMLGKDPILQYSVHRLQQNNRQADRAYAEGKREYARHALRESIGLCFNCHTTQNFGPQHDFAGHIGKGFRLSPTEKADYFVATRQFDSALESLTDVVKSPTALLEDPHEQLRALRKYLFLQVRVKNDPAPAIRLIDMYLAWEKLPYFIASDATAWLESLKSWQKEKPNATSSIQRAQKLMTQGEKRQVSGYQGGMVDYLRATQVLHEALRINDAASDKAQIYHLLGRSYDTLSDLGIWDLPEVYFEACVRTVPKTARAKECYRDYERSVILGFSGTAGIYLPAEECQRLQELKSLAGL